MQVHKASFKGQHKEQKESESARVYDVTALKLRLLLAH